MSNSYLYGLRELFFASGIVNSIVSPLETFFDGSIIILLFNFNFLSKIKLLILLYLRIRGNCIIQLLFCK